MDRLEGLLSSINDAVWSVDLTTKKFLYVNERLAEICEKTFVEIKDNPKIWLELIHPEDIEPVKKELSKITRDTHVEVEHRIITSKGIKWVVNKQILVFDETSCSETLVGIVTDITPRKEAEIKLTESEKTYRYLFLHNPSPIFIYDLNTLEFLAVNVAAIDHYGYSNEEFLSMTILDIRPKEDIPKVIKSLKNKKPKTSGFQYWRHIKKDKSIIYTNNTGYEILYKGRRAEMVLIHDVSDEVKTREEIIISKNNLDTLINTTNDFIWSVDKNYYFMYGNEAFCRHYEKLIRKKINPGDYFFAEGTDQIIKNHWKHNYDKALKGELISFTEQTYLPNNRVIIAEVKIHPIYNESEIIGVGCFSRDITDRVKNEKRVLDQNERLREITSLASHEIRGPVTSIMGLVSLFNYQDPSDLFNGSVIEHIKETAEKLDEVIHQIVDKAAEFEYRNSIMDSATQSQLKK